MHARRRQRPARPPTLPHSSKAATESARRSRRPAAAGAVPRLRALSPAQGRGRSPVLYLLEYAFQQSRDADAARSFPADPPRPRGAGPPVRAHARRHSTTASGTAPVTPSGRAAARRRANSKQTPQQRGHAPSTQRPAGCMHPAATSRDPAAESAGRAPERVSTEYAEKLGERWEIEDATRHQLTTRPAAGARTARTRTA